MATGSRPGSGPQEEENPARPSTATHRRSYYEQQRGNPSRPSTSSGQRRPSTSRSQGRRPDRQPAYQGLVSRDPGPLNSPRDPRSRFSADGSGRSYDEPEDFQDLDEVAAGPPTSTTEGPSRLEQALTNESARRRQHGSHNQRNGDQSSQGLTESAAVPPVQSSNAEPHSAPNQRRPKDESNDADGENLSAPAPSVYQSPRGTSRSHKSQPTGIKTGTARPVPRYVTEMYTISYLIFFSIMGTLARLGMQWLTFYPGAPIVTPVIWANFAGSLFMGFLAEDQGLFRDHFTTPGSEKRTSDQIDGAELEKSKKAESSKTKKTIPLYIGLATGFCGSFTSFSSFARDFFLALSNNLPTPLNHPYTSSAETTTSTISRSGGYSFEAWAAVVLFTLALSIGGLIGGAHIALFLAPYTPRISRTLTRGFFDPLMILLGWGCWLGAVFLCIWPPDRPSGPASRGSWSNETWRGEVLFALVFAPVGCLLRFYASLKLNPIVAAFPLGTFAVNMLGTAIEGMCYDIQHVGVGTFGMVGGGRVGCQVLQGVMDGFCGCLTTVSTWVAEINGLRRSHAWRYAFASIVGALCLMVVIMGSVRWSVGYGSPACNTGYPDKIHG